MAEVESSIVGSGKEGGNQAGAGHRIAGSVTAGPQYEMADLTRCHEVELPPSEECALKPRSEHTTVVDHQMSHGENAFLNTVLQLVLGACRMTFCATR